MLGSVLLDAAHFSFQIACRSSVTSTPERAKQNRCYAIPVDTLPFFGLFYKGIYISKYSSERMADGERKLVKQRHSPVGVLRQAPTEC